MSTAHAPGGGAPAWVWSVALGGALGLALLMLTLDRLWPGLPALAGPYLNLARLDEPPRHGPRVVALGDSKLRFGVAFDGELRQGLPLDFVRINWNSAKPADLAPALAALCRQPPALLLVQADLLIWQREPVESPGQRLRQHYRENLERLGLLWGRRHPYLLADNLGRTRDGWQPEGRIGPPQRLSPAELQARQAEALRGWQPAAPEALQSWQHSLDCLHAAGTEIALLSLPRAPFAQALMAGPLARHEVEALARADAGRGWRHWSAPLRFEDAEFFDAAHLRASGQARYSAWLREALARWLQARAASLPAGAAAQALAGPGA
ncbi:hypothetical protein JI742_01740 [Piscinibacter sp. Jin2]|uniref:SGNH/GDSL hydrolase family protein n=1 Tax=Aquariibacter lacus TaxID=2801332 RepID=A0A9X0XBC8_9BURK|nr:hypothetical protein [Piscinibacter lacus]MBL0718600.1 hypothetical protein [Piscinibacter lacus]